MNLLFLTHRLPCPPDRGCKVRAGAILHWLCQRHDVWCAGFLDSVATRELQDECSRSVASLQQTCRGVLSLPFRPTLAGYRALGSLISGGTATEGYFGSRALREGVLAWSKQVEFDAVFAFSSGIAPLALAVPAKRRVLCMDDLDSQKWQELAVDAGWLMKRIYGTEARRVSSREREWIDAFDATLMISQREADLVTDPQLRRKVHVIPPVLPEMVASIQEENPADRHNPAADAGGEPPVVGFVGAMDYGPNVDAVCWFAREIWPRIKRQCPTARFWIVGRSPVTAVRELAKDQSIIVTGAVADVNEYLNRMHVHVAPLRISRGVQIKVLAAMAAARPCVVTSTVAEGLGVRPGRDLVVADSPAVLAQSVVDLLEHPEKATALGRAGKAFVRRIDPQRVMGQIEALLGGERATSRVARQVSWSVGSARAASPPQCVPAII